MKGPFADPVPLTVSVPERMRALGYPTTAEESPMGPSLATECGQAVRDWWIGRHGARPVTWLTKKSSGKGSHHKARYPQGVQVDLDRIIREVADGRGVVASVGAAPPQLPLL